MKWPDGTLRWLYLAFPADANGQATTQYNLKLSSTPSYSQPTNTSGRIQISETNDSITVSTGSLIFVVRKTGKGFNLFNRVLIDKDGDGLINDEIVSPSLNNGAVIWDRFDSTYTSANDLTYKVKIEESGPLYCIIKITGSHSNGSNDPRFYGYQCRITALAGKSYLKVQYTLKNSFYKQRGALAMHGMSIKLRSNVSGTPNVTFFSDSLLSASSLTDSAYLFQRTPSSFLVKNSSTTVDAGNRALGWVDISNNSWGVALGDYEFASNCPNEVGAQSDGTIEARTFPKRYVQGTLDSVGYKWSDRFFLGAGEHKTHRFCIYFHKGTAASANVSNVMANFNHPLLPVMDRAWVAWSRAMLGDIAPATGAIPDPITVKLPLVNPTLSTPPYTGSTENAQYFDSWCTFGEAFSRNENNATEIFENQGTRYWRWLTPYTHRTFEANAWLYADFRGCHVDSAVVYNPPTYYSTWAGAYTKDPFHSVGTVDRHLWIRPQLGSNAEHYSARDLFTYYLTSGDLKIRDALYEFAQMHNSTLTTWNYASATPGLGGMSRGSGSSWASLLMASLICNEQSDTIGTKTPEQYFKGITTEWFNGRPNKVGIQGSLHTSGCWTLLQTIDKSVVPPDTNIGPHVFFEAIVDMPYSWYMEYFWSDTIMPYLSKHVKTWADSVFSDSGGLSYDGWGVDGTKGSSWSNWRIPGSLSLLYRQYRKHGGTDSLLMIQVRRFCKNNPDVAFATWDLPYYDKKDLTFSQAYLLQEINPDLFYKDSCITWVSDPTVIATEKTSIENDNTLKITVAPNPFNPVTMINLHGFRVNEHMTVYIHSIDGRLIQKLYDGPSRANFIWNGKDGRGQNISAGFYCITVKTGTNILRIRAVLLK
jgi:hypothetical protein